jgi:hypothetical protein
MLTYGDVPKVLDELKKAYESDQKVIKYLREKIENLKDENYKDTELAALKEEMEDYKEQLLHGFGISQEEYDSICEWKRKHEEEVHGAKTFDQHLRLQGVSGGRYTYIFVPTAIGTSGVVRCSCGAEFEFQEIW